MTAVSNRGKRRGVPLIDGIDKVTGRARFTADLDHSDALVGRIFRSPVSHGDILRLDVCWTGSWRWSPATIARTHTAFFPSP
jgi:CO/xanthine dehydrogenase Mo-binding subunit